MVKVILCSIVVSGLVSFSMMKLQMRMIEKWMDEFFEKETKWAKKILREQIK